MLHLAISPAATLCPEIARFSELKAARSGSALGSAAAVGYLLVGPSCHLFEKLIASIQSLRLASPELPAVVAYVEPLCSTWQAQLARFPLLELRNATLWAQALNITVRPESRDDALRSHILKAALPYMLRDRQKVLILDLDTIVLRDVRWSSLAELDGRAALAPSRAAGLAPLGPLATSSVEMDRNVGRRRVCADAEEAAPAAVERQPRSFAASDE